MKNLFTAISVFVLTTSCVQSQSKFIIGALDLIRPYSVQFNASRLASGIYFYSLRSGSFSVVKKMSLI